MLRYIRCPHCGKLELEQSSERTVCSFNSLKEINRDVIFIIFGICTACLVKILNTGRRNFVKTRWIQIFLRDQLDN